MKTFTSHSLEETKKIANEWLSDISNTCMPTSVDMTDVDDSDVTNTGNIANDEALVVGLSGHLGAGKTAFTKMVAEILGVKETVTSPTFVIMKIYDINSNIKLPIVSGQSSNLPISNLQSQISSYQFPWSRLIHIDAYRLERREELEALDWENLVADKNNLILIEWPENVGLKEFAPKAHLSFQIIDDAHEISVE